MEQIVSVLLFLSAYVVVQCLPIYNGFSVKFNDIKEYKKPKTFGALFERISQDAKEDESSRRKTKTNTNFRHTAELGTGCTNQIAKIIFPTRIPERVYNYSQTWNNAPIINIPIIRQPFTGYKILVATAPPNMRLSKGDGGDERVVVYIVFPEDDGVDNSSINIPAIYFVNKLGVNIDKDKKELEDPMFIIDSNRTVTGLKSNEVAKYVKFKNLFSRRHNYRLVR